MHAIRMNSFAAVLTIMVAAFGILAFVPTASAQVCAFNSTQTGAGGTPLCACPTTGPGVTCLGGQLYNATAPFCRADTRPCASNQQYNCATTSCQCNTTAFPCGGCTATNPAITVGNSCTSPIGGVYTNACGSGTCACPAATALCSLNNTCVSNACGVGLTYDTASCQCIADVRLNPAGAQSGWFTVAGTNDPAGSPANGSVYFNTTDNKLKCRVGGAWADCAGGGAGTLTGSGVTGLVSFWTGASSVASDAAFGWNNATKQLTLGLGTVAAPAYSFVGDLNNGIYSPAADSFAIATNGIERLRIDAAGKVMFGGVPADPLGALAFEFTSPTSDPLFRFTAPSARWAGFRFDRPTADATNEKWFIGMKTNSDLPVNGLFFRRNAASDTLTLDNTSNSFAARLTPATNVEGLKIITSNYSPLAIRNALDSADLFRVSQTGQVSIVDGTQGLNKVLVSNAAGVASWATLASIPGGGGACSGRSVVGYTAPYTGNLNNAVVKGYDAADALCNNTLPAATFSGSKVCTAEEVLSAYKCNPVGNGSFIRTGANDGAAWVNAGPPGYTAWSNDCNAWQNAAPAAGISYFGRVWEFAAANGGRGTMTVCTASIRFACCK